ncbi:hypothetical protein D3C73_1530940 [compost metagenome]
MGHDGENEYTSLKLNVVQNIEQKFLIPVKKDGSYDLAAQKEIANKYLKIEEIKKTICNKIDEVLTIKIIM